MNVGDAPLRIPRNQTIINDYTAVRAGARTLHSFIHLCPMWSPVA